MEGVFSTASRLVGDESVGSGIARKWVSVSSAFTHMVYLLRFLSYLADRITFASAHPSDPDTMIVTSLEVIGSSRGENAERLTCSGRINQRKPYCNCNRRNAVCPFHFDHLIKLLNGSN